VLTDRPTATCSNPRCQFVIDLTDDRVVLTTTTDGGAATCPHCGGTAPLSRDGLAQARIRSKNIRR
jgi:hypothetical protein